MRLATRLIGIVLFVLSIAGAARADEAALRGIIAKFATAAGYSEIEAVVDELGVLGDPLGARSLNALNDGRLVVRTDDRTVLVSESRNGREVLADPVNAEVIGDAAGVAVDKVKIKNSIRRKIAAVISALTLMARDPVVRLAAAEQLFVKPDPAQLEALETAIAAEKDPFRPYPDGRGARGHRACDLRRRGRARRCRRDHRGARRQGRAGVAVVGRRHR